MEGTAVAEWKMRWDLLAQSGCKHFDKNCGNIVRRESEGLGSEKKIRIKNFILKVNLQATNSMEKNANIIVAPEVLFGSEL